MKEGESLTIFEERHHHFGRLIELYTWLVIILGLLFLQLPLQPTPNRIAIYLVASLMAIFVFLWHHVIHLQISSVNKNFLESIIDVIAIFFIVRVSGGVESYLTFLYILPNLAIAFPGSRRNMFIILGLSSFFILLELVLYGRSTPLNFYSSALIIWSLYLAILYGRFLSKEIVLAQKRTEETKIEKIKEISRLKDEFVFIVSHELRTPIAGIRGFLELIVLGEEGKLSGKVRSLAETASIKVEEISRLVSNLLDLSRIESARLQFNLQNFGVAELVFSYTSKSNLLFNDKSVELVVRPIDQDLQVFTDKDYFGEILSNLLANGLKMCSKFGSVEVSVQKTGDLVEIKVKDNGHGLGKDDLERIFEKFYQPKSAEAGGLDLFVTKKLVEKMGGELLVESEKGKGSCFTFTLPAARKQAEGSALQPSVVKPTTLN